MFPHPKHQGAILIAALLGGQILLLGADVARAADGTPGCSLVMASSGIGATLAFAGLLLAALIPAALISCTGNPLGGVFALGTALAFPAIRGGGMDGFLRGLDSASSFWAMAGESLLWALLMGTGVLACFRVGQVARHRMPALVKLDAATPADPETADLRKRLIWGIMPEIGSGLWMGVDGLSGWTRTTSPHLQKWASAGVAAVAGLAAASLLVRTAEPWQAIWGVGFAFVLAGLLAHQLFPAGGAVGILISPLLAAALIYAWIAAFGPDAMNLLASYYEGHFYPAARALPIYYASAGVAGAAMGVGWSQVLILGHLAEQAHQAKAQEKSQSDLQGQRA